MIKPGALVMAVVMVAVSAGTYFGLDKLPPNLLPKALRRASAEAAATPAAVVPAPVTVASAQPAAAPAAATADAPTEQELAEEPAPAAAPAEAAPAPKAELAAAETSTPAPQPEPAAAPEPAPEATPPPAPKAKPKPKKAAPAPAAETAPSAETASAAAAAPEPERPIKPAPPEADTIKPWWPNPASMPEEQLKLQYAGQVQGENAIALLFSGKVNIDAVRKNAVVRTLDGETVGGSWELGNNPKLAVLRGVKPGRYTVILNPEIADVKGYMLGTTLQGPVYIKQP